MKIREVFSKTVLTRTAISGLDYCINPYIGCGHGCSYCYASFMKRFTGHLEPWGAFVDVKINAAQVLRRQLRRAKSGLVSLSTVTDPYQPLEERYRVTRECLEALLESQFPVTLLTRSSLCLRDIDLFRRFARLEVGVSVTTHDEETRKIFENRSPTIGSRVQTLRTLHDQKISTYAFIGPMLPLDPVRLFGLLAGAVDEVLIDRMNYGNKTKAIYRKHGLDPYLEDDYFHLFGNELKNLFERSGIPVTLLF